MTTGGAAAGQWRLPEISEFDDLWADPAVGGSNNGLDANFSEVVGTSLYWTGTSSSSTLAVVFSSANGLLVDFPRGSDLYVVVVRSAAAASARPPDRNPVPEPQTLALALLALGAAAARLPSKPPKRAPLA